MTSQVREISVERIERIKCNSTLAITSVIKGTQIRLYNELDPESFKSRHWFRKLLYFFTKLKQQVYHNTFLVLFHKPIIYIILV